jgi:hypothetical protein
LPRDLFFQRWPISSNVRFLNQVLIHDQ